MRVVVYLLPEEVVHRLEDWAWAWFQGPLLPFPRIRNSVFSVMCFYIDDVLFDPKENKKLSSLFELLLVELISLSASTNKDVRAESFRSFLKCE